MKRKLEIINGVRVSKCGARFVKLPPAIFIEALKPEKKNIPRKVEAVTETASEPEKKEPESLFDFRKGRHENAPIEDEQ